MSDGFSADEIELDLFGAPVGQIRERWGRPSFAKSQENQQLVATLRAKNWSHARISRFMGCDEKTLRKHFSRELEAGADLIEGMAMQVLVQKMRQGHVAATRSVLEITASGRAAPPAPKEPKVETPGKKEAARLRASEAPGGGWGELLN